MTTSERFSSKVSKTQTETGCLLWLNSRDQKGYGRMYWNGRPVAAHRIAWRLTYGDIPQGLCVLHRCDNPRCVNPDHLFLGTLADNNRDMAQKGRAVGGTSFGINNGPHKHPERMRRGETHGMSKLTEAIVRNARHARLNGSSFNRIARSIGCDVQTIRKAILGITWKHVV